MPNSDQELILEEIAKMKKKLKKITHRRRRHRHVSYRRSRYSTSRTRSRSRIRSQSTSPPRSPHRDNHSVSPHRDNHSVSPHPSSPVAPPELLGKENIDSVTTHVVNVEEAIPEALLTALGNDEPLEEKYGPNINNLIASRWENTILHDNQEVKDILMTYKVPKNCPLLEAPQLNAEVKAAVNESARNRDQVLQTKQQQLGIALSCLGQAMTKILAGHEVSETLKLLSDGTKILTSLHHGETNTRKQLLAPLLDKSFTKITESIPRNKYLFGENLTEIIKSNKEIERSGFQLRKPKPTFNRSGNWVGPSRQSQQKAQTMCGGLKRPAVQSQTKKPYQPIKKPLKRGPVNRPERDYQRARPRR